MTGTTRLFAVAEYVSFMAAYQLVSVLCYVPLADMEATFPSEMPTIPYQAGVETGICSTIAVYSVVQVANEWQTVPSFAGIL